MFYSKKKLNQVSTTAWLDWQLLDQVYTCIYILTKKQDY